MANINETAAAGSTSAGSIATVPSNRLGGMQTRMNLKDFMLKFYSGVTNRNKYGPLKLEGSIVAIEESAAHPYQLDDATSRLKNMQKQGEHDETDMVTYGIKDDTGNIMLISVPLEQGEEIERRVAQALADVMDFKKTGKGENKSLAELLYELKDEFDIIDAQFPNIPKDSVYNADEISNSLPEAEGDDMGSNDEIGDDMGDEDPMGDDDPNAPDTAGEDDLDGEPDMDGMGSDDEDEVGDDFEGGEDKESLLISVLGMLKSQNEKEIAQANAEEEKAKAEQAKLAAASSKDQMVQQEEMVAAQAELDAQKDKEKKAKEMAELAKFNYKKKNGLGEGFSGVFREAILELDANDTVQSLRRQQSTIPVKYKSEPTDDPDTKQFKAKQKQHAQREVRIKMKAARDAEDYEDKQQSKDQGSPL